MAAAAPEPNPPLQAALARAFAALVLDDAVARADFESLLAQAEAAGDRVTCAVCAAGMVVAYAIEFADFRGLGGWTARLDAQAGADGGLALGLGPIDRLRVDSALITLPSLDGAFGFDPRCEAAAVRAAQAVDAVHGLSPDERMLHTKMLLDYHSLRHEVPQIEQVMAIGHEQVRRPGVSAVWQARWWMLLLLNHEYFGRTDAARQAAARAQALVDGHALAALRFELACIEMSAALKADDLGQAERLFREIELLRPAVRPGRLPHGLRAQALLLARRGHFEAALERVRLLLALCAQAEVPRRDQGAYEVLRAYCLAALARWAEAMAVLEALRPDHQGAQGELLEAIIGTVQALHAGARPSSGHRPGSRAAAASPGSRRASDCWSSSRAVTWTAHRPRPRPTTTPCSASPGSPTPTTSRPRAPMPMAGGNSMSWTVALAVSRPRAKIRGWRMEVSGSRDVWRNGKASPQLAAN